MEQSNYLLPSSAWLFASLFKNFNFSNDSWKNDFRLTLDYLSIRFKCSYVALNRLLESNLKIYKKYLLQGQ